MINRAQLLADLQAVLRKLEADLLERSEAMPEVKATLAAEHQRATQAERTAQSYEDWRADYGTQIAVAWVLSVVFARFLEDNRLVDPPRIAGPGERLAPPGTSTNCTFALIRLKRIVSIYCTSSTNSLACRGRRTSSARTIRCTSYPTGSAAMRLVSCCGSSRRSTPIRVHSCTISPT